ncbi:hypothetical protein ABH935_005379 [Catenulispora sp. GAS73]|uniref:hypothetical protein n=1 Tax=Catenulispora sp. GAS73 TaxID=3156269 RepID=UPI003512CACE
MKEERILADRRLVDQAADARHQLEEERSIAERRIIEERAFATAERLHERQTAAAAVLLEYLGDLAPLLWQIPNTATAMGAMPATLNLRPLESIDPVKNLVRGAKVQALLLGNQELAARYRRLVHLVLTAAHNTDRQFAQRTIGDLRNYSKFVRLSLQALVDGRPLPDPGVDTYPNLRRSLDKTLWHPINVPLGWDEEAELDPHDVQFRPQGWHALWG